MQIQAVVGNTGDLKKAEETGSQHARMKFAKYQQNNLVPEWRKKYLDVRTLLMTLLTVFSTRRGRNS